MGGGENVCKFLKENLKVSDHLENQGMERRIILKWILKE
jgi:hypothetical protein